MTVVGPGGAGKTSVAVELARRVVGGYPDGVWLVELAAVGDPALLAEVVVAALGLQRGGRRARRPPRPAADRLAGFVRDKALLVVLDNCEHLVGACAELVQRLLRGRPQGPGPGDQPRGPGRARRGRLAGPAAGGPRRRRRADGGCRLAGADGAEAPPEVLGGYDAVRLFVERAATADPGFTLDAGQRGRWWPSCAGAWMGCRWPSSWPRPGCGSCRRPRSRPGWVTGSGCWLGVGGPSTPRQRTLRATVDWSWELLEEPDRRLLAAAVGVLGWLDGGGGRGGVLAATGWSRGRCWRGCSGWWTGRWWWRPGGEPARFAVAGDAAGLRGRAAGRGRGDRGRGGPAHRLVPRPGRAGRPSIGRAGAGCGWSPPTTTTCGRCWTGRWPRRDLDTALRLAGALGWYWCDRPHRRGPPAAGSGCSPWPTGGRRPRSWPGRSRRRRWSRCQLTPTAGHRRRGPAQPGAVRAVRGPAGGRLLQAAAGPAPSCSCAVPAATAVRLVEEAEATFEELGDRWGEAFAGRAGSPSRPTPTGLPKRAEEAGQLALERFQAARRPVGGGPVAVRPRRGRPGSAATWRRPAAAYERALAAAREGGPMWVMLASLTELGGLVALRGDDARAAALHAEAAALIRRTGLRRGYRPPLQRDGRHRPGPRRASNAPASCTRRR